MSDETGFGKTGKTVMRSVADYPSCNSNRLAPVITIVTTNSARVDCVVTTVCQFCLLSDILVMYILSFFSKERRIASIILRAHTPHYHSRKSSATIPTRLQLSSASSFLPPQRQLFSAGPSYHARNCPLCDSSIHYPCSCPLSVFPFHSTY